MTNHPNRSRRGAPRKADAKQNITLRLRPDVIAIIKAIGIEAAEERIRGAG